MTLRRKKQLSLVLSAILIACTLTSCRSRNSGEVQTTDTEPHGGIGRVTSTDNKTETEIDRSEKTICIDPGHGFGDVGASSKFIGDLNENDITLDVSKYLEEELVSRGYSVFLSHDGKTIPKTKIDDGNNLFNFKERVEYVNTKDMDYFISIHCNVYANAEDVNGMRIYYSEESQVPVEKPKKASEALYDALAKAFPDYRKPIVKMTPAAESYYVTHWTKTCALLIEIGYLTNKSDAENMIDPLWQKELAKSIANGIDSYFAK